MAKGALAGMMLRSEPALVDVALGSMTTNAMATLNRGWCARNMALDTRDYKGVYLNWSSVATPGTCQLRVETIDATTGKPTGSLYDASASKSFTPTAGWQLVQFDVLPTAGRTVGTEYGLVLLTTVGGTTQTLRSHISNSNYAAYPAIVLTAADGTTRGNFAEVASSLPVATILFEDDLEEADNLLPFATTTTFPVYGTRAWGGKLTLTGGVVVRGASVPYWAINGTPGDLRLRIFSGNTQVANASVTVDYDSLKNGSTRRLRLTLPPITLAAGTYRVLLCQSDITTTSGNNYTFYEGVGRSAAAIPSGWVATQTTDITAGTITFTDTAANQPVLDLILDDLVAGSAGGLLLPHGGLGGGLL